MLFGPHAPAALAAFVLLCACAQPPPPGASAGSPSPEVTAGAGILLRSSPPAGATVAGPVRELVLHFSPGARLSEVTIIGPEGAMPMMVTSIGEVEHYALPLPDLRQGRYEVAWEAGAGGITHRGKFTFMVR